MDRLRAMSVFAQAVESGSFSAAGRRLGMPLPTVSRHIAELEAHLETRLLNRTTRQLTLTDAGRSYLASCKTILEQVDEAERGAAGEFSAPKGELVISAPIVFGRLHMLPIICEFLSAYPDVDVRLSLSDRVVHLMEDHVDLAVRIGALPDSSLIAARAGFIRRVVCASATYLKQHGTPECPPTSPRIPASRSTACAIPTGGRSGNTTRKSKRRSIPGLRSTRRKPLSTPPWPASASRAFCRIRPPRRFAPAR